MSLPPLLSERARGTQIALAVLAPAVLGAVCGYVLGIGAGGYLALSLLAAIGGVAAGVDHDGARAGAKRGLAGGTIFGVSVLIVHQIHGVAARVDLPDPAVLLVVITAFSGALLGALGGSLRARALRR